MRRKSILRIVGNIAVCVLAVILAAVVHICVGVFFVSVQPYQVTNETIKIQGQALKNANAFQHNADVMIIPVENQLYYYVRSWPGSLGKRSRFDGRLCAIEQGEILPIQKMEFLSGADEQFFYYETGDCLFCYDVVNREAKEILPLKEYFSGDYFLDENGTFKIIPDDDVGLCYLIEDGIIVGVEEGKNWGQYLLGEKVYSLKRESSSDSELYCQGEDISNQLGNGNYRALIPFQDGLILINDGYGNLLYYINADGIQAIFPEFPCMCSESSVNFYENYVFVSFKRWESYDESGLGLSSFENDTLEGTYRIDMTDRSIKKISDSIYNGMFIFDDSGIFCTNSSGDICKIDFAGNSLIQIVD